MPRPFQPLFSVPECHCQDRRTLVDRRDGLERRGSGLRQPPSPVPRAYGFRELHDVRRSPQDRRLYPSEECTCGAELDDSACTPSTPATGKD